MQWKSSGKPHFHRHPPLTPLKAIGSPTIGRGVILELVAGPGRTFYTRIDAVQVELFILE